VALVALVAEVLDLDSRDENLDGLSILAFEPLAGSSVVRRKDKTSLSARIRLLQALEGVKDKEKSVALVALVAEACETR
jgi:hypothetical protein